MADIKTILRETSVILGLYNIEIENSNSGQFVNKLKKCIINSTEVELEINKILEIDISIHKNIISNGFTLGRRLIELFKKVESVKWVGANVGMQYPFDIIVNGEGISLKEDSYILKNPAFSDYLNSLTQINPPFSTIHVFRHFAPELFEKWFQYTLSKAFEEPDGTIYFNQKRGHHFKKKNDSLIFEHKELKTVKIHKSEPLKEVEFNKKVGGKFIEHSFSKWINEKLSEDKKYTELKKQCSQEAGMKLKSFIEKNLNIDSRKILELVQIYEQKYLYAKVGNLIYEVPTYSNVNVKLKSIEISVPQSQLNVLFTFQFSTQNSSADVSFRVECRYSHGQFKGVPEAKLYYIDNSQIENIYYKII